MVFKIVNSAYVVNCQAPHFQKEEYEDALWCNRQNVFFSYGIVFMTKLIICYLNTQ